MVTTEHPVPAADTVASAAPAEERATVVSEPMAPPKRSRRGLVVGGVLALAAVAGGVALVATGGDDAPATTDGEPIRAQVAEVRDLVETSSLDGTLRFADVESVTALTDGVVTGLPVDGSALGVGDVAYEINGSPTVAIHGDIPLYRSLAEGSEGDDVLLLEENLVAMGHHLGEGSTTEDEVDDGFVVDGVFDAATERAVERWQDELGVPVTGVVAPTDVLVVPGSAVVSSSAVEVGDRVAPGAPIYELRPTGTVESIHAAHTGEIELVAEAGSELDSGVIAYTVDDLPIVTVVTTQDMDRVLRAGVADGDDVEVLEAMLLGLGYDADGELEVDDVFDDATEEALLDWQDDLEETYDEFVVDGVFDPADALVLPTATTVGTPAAEGRDVTASGSVLWSTATSTSIRVVDTSVEVVDRASVSEGATLDVELPDGTVVPALVVDVADSSTLDPTDPTADPMLAVELRLDEVPAEYADFGELDVDVLIVDRRADGVVTVPVSALVSTGDGYAVEIVDGATTRFVAVQPGMFADGFVEVSGIDAGTAVVVSS